MMHSFHLFEVFLFQCSRLLHFLGIHLSLIHISLYIVDGVPINNDRLGDNSVDFGSGAGDINPEDLESVTVLKGASATALYGSRAANGVIMIRCV